MYKFCTISEVEEDEKTKLAIQPRSTQHNIGKLGNISSELLQNPPIYENVVLNMTAQGSNEFQVTPNDTHKHSDAIYEDMHYKRAKEPRNKPAPPPRFRQALNKVSVPQMDMNASFTLSQNDRDLKHDVVKEKSQTRTAHENQTSKPQLKPKPKPKPKPRLNTLKQHKVSLPTSSIESDFPLKKTTSITTDYLPMMSLDDEDKKMKKSTSLLLMPNEESELKKSSSAGYLSMIRSDKGNYEINDPDDVIPASETEEYDLSGHTYCHVKDVVKFETPQDNRSYYSQINEAKIEKCIYSIDNSDLEIKSQVSKDELSEMLYLPVRDNIDESISVDLKTSLGIGCSGEKYYDFDVAEEMVRAPHLSPVVEKRHETRTFINPVIGKQPQTSVTDSKNTSVFVDFSDDSLLAKLGAKMRKDLESKKYES